MGWDRLFRSRGRSGDGLSPSHGEPAAPETVSDLPDHFFRELQIEFLLHELKDPFSVIHSGVQALLTRQEKYGPLSPRQEQTLQRIRRSAGKAREMINHLLEIGRSEAGCFACNRFRPGHTALSVLAEAIEVMDGTVLEETADREATLRSLAGRGIVLDLSAALLDAEMVQDEVKFRQIVGNLIKNALHHRRRRMEIRGWVQEASMALEVADDGPGIHPDHHQVIFHRYAQVHACPDLPRHGHGLGLAGARILAKRMGGDIEVISEAGKGAIFRLVLPMVLAGSGEEGSGPTT
jgi:signal transduction histidine kinase